MGCVFGFVCLFFSFQNRRPSNTNLIWKYFLILLSLFNLLCILSIHVTVCAELQGQIKL